MSEGKKAKKEQAQNGGRPARFKTEAELDFAITQYLDRSTPAPVMVTNEDGVEIALTDKQGQPVYTQVFPTVAGLAHFLGYETRQSIFDLKQDARYSYVIKRAVLYIESLHEQNLALRDKPVGDIFWLKNHGWTDKQEIEHSGAVQIIDDIPKIKP